MAFAIGIRRAGALSMLPAMDGCITLTAVGLALAVIGGVPYRKALLAMLPVVLLSFVAARNYGTPPLAVFGVEAMLSAVVGLAVVAHARLSTVKAPPRALRADFRRRSAAPRSTQAGRCAKRASALAAAPVA